MFRNLVFTSALATLACVRNDTRPTQATIVDSGGVRITSISAPPESLPAWTLDADPVRVLTGAETGDETAFAFVGPVRFLTDGGLVVGDVASSRLLVYSDDGRFVTTLGRRGDGPGELRRLESISVSAGDTIATFDPSLRRLSFWHPDAGFVRSVNLADDGSLDAWPADAWPWHGSSIVVLQLSTTPQESVPLSSGVRRWAMRAHLSLRDSAGRVLARSPDFDGMYTGLDERGDSRLPFSNRPFVAVSKDRVYFGSGSVFDLTYLDSSFNVAGSVRWPAVDEPLTSAEVERVRDEAIALISRRPLPPNPFARNFAPEILPERRPSIGRVLVDPARTVWVERFEAQRMGTAVQVPGDRWRVLSSSGEPTATLRLPPSTRLEDIRGDQAVVVQRDSLDVQTVAVFRVRR